ncbi:hypothetical protein KIN20_033396 [Parelaphostrongylus tenuis]|uniref:Uncharacterized protein n=1 Tax=Parelaphostrongylus tenuis TaxID=148309 RepID=A0AAD5R800_PARTN|nr:hypothetical protein KIN20_033396 [Parelaphostrongylus tenuis]
MQTDERLMKPKGPEGGEGGPQGRKSTGAAVKRCRSFEWNRLARNSTTRLACPIGCEPEFDLSVITKIPYDNDKCQKYYTYGKYRDRSENEWYSKNMKVDKNNFGIVLIEVYKLWRIINQAAVPFVVEKE